MAKGTQKPQINVKLDPVKDHDIITFLEDQPRSWTVRQALREYMANLNIVIPAAAESPKKEEIKPVSSTEPVQPQKQEKAADSHDDEDPFAPVE